MYSACNTCHHHKNTFFCYQPCQGEKHPFPLVYLTSVHDSTPVCTSQFIREVLETCNALLIFKIKNRKIKILVFSSYTLSAPRHMRTWIWQFLVLLTEPHFCYWVWIEESCIYTFIFISGQVPYLSALVSRDILEMVMAQMDACNSVICARVTPVQMDNVLWVFHFSEAIGYVRIIILVSHLCSMFSMIHKF